MKNKEVNQKMKINEELAELIGIILGDGHMHTKHNLFTIVGSLEDYYYYQDYVMPLFEKISGKIPSIRKRNDRNAYYLMLTSKDLMSYLTNKIGMTRGSKINASIPKIIFSNKKFARAFLRGIFDTDGCLKFSKQTKKINYYPRVQIALQKSHLATEIGTLLKLVGFSYGSWEDSRFNGAIYYNISGKKNTEKWIKEISPSNPVHISKFHFWKRFGYYIPKSTLKSRLARLKTKTL